MSSFDRVFREKRSLMLPLMIALGVNVLLLVLAVLPLTRSVSSEEVRAAAVATDRAAAEQTLTRAQAIVTGKARADSELTHFYGQVLPADQSGARRIAYLNVQQLAQASGLSVSNQETSVQVPEEADGLTKYNTTLTLSGSYRGLRQFIYALETRPAFLVIESLTLDAASNTGQALEVTVKLATYYRTPNGS